MRHSPPARPAAPSSASLAWVHVMSIRPEMRARYPADWRARSRFVRFSRARGRREWCGAENGKPHPQTGSRVVLTAAHVFDKRPEAASLLEPGRALPEMPQRPRRRRPRPGAARASAARANAPGRSVMSGRDWVSRRHTDRTHDPLPRSKAPAGAVQAIAYAPPCEGAA